MDPSNPRTWNWRVFPPHSHGSIRPGTAEFRMPYYVIMMAEH